MQLRGRARKHDSRFIVLADARQFSQQEQLREQERLLNVALQSSKLLFPEFWMRYIRGIADSIEQNEAVVAAKVERQRRLIFGNPATSLEFSVFVPVSLGLRSYCKCPGEGGGLINCWIYSCFSSVKFKPSVVFCLIFPYWCSQI